MIDLGSSGVCFKPNGSFRTKSNFKKSLRMKSGLSSSVLSLSSAFSVGTTNWACIPSSPIRAERYLVLST
jgi:hypothetical protein